MPESNRMRRFIRHLLALTATLALSGCIIGTWPTPEDRDDRTRSQDGGTSSGSIAPEACDGLDNDADGSIDEGCDCVREVRGCIGFDGSVCGFGLQRCAQGVWQECGELQEPFSEPRTLSVRIVNVVPSVLTLGDAQGIRVSVEPVPICQGIQVPLVNLVLSASSPMMRVRATARDDASGADTVASDGLYEAELSNAFGPAVQAQDLTLTVTTTLSGADIYTTVTVPLEAP